MTPERSLRNRVPAWRSKPSALAFRSHCWQERSTLTLIIQSRSCASVLNGQTSLTARLPIKNTILKEAPPFVDYYIVHTAACKRDCFAPPWPPQTNFLAKSLIKKLGLIDFSSQLLASLTTTICAKWFHHFSKKSCRFFGCNQDQICYTGCSWSTNNSLINLSIRNKKPLP